jgi:hypothetical protein
MKIVVARRIGRRGEGLGNEIFAWAKGFIASNVLGATQVGPSWGLNLRKYYRNFNSNRADWILEELLCRLPHFAFSEADYRESGEIDFGRAIESWARRKGLLERNRFIITVDGMYGGYSAIRNARSFLRAKLLNSRDALRNVFQVSSGLDPAKLFVAVHIRSNNAGFLVLKEGEGPRGRFNICIPGEWYLHVCQALRERFGNCIQFHILTDRGGPEYDEAIRRFNPRQQRQTGLTECSDLLLMAQADLRICSISSYSMIAAFLSGGPYIWYEPQLTLEDSLYTLWGLEEAQRKADSITSEARAFASMLTPSLEASAGIQGHAMGTGEALPPGLIVQLERKLQTLDTRTNLLEYGALPAWACAGDELRRAFEAEE